MVSVELLKISEEIYMREEHILMTVCLKSQEEAYFIVLKDKIEELPENKNPVIEKNKATESCPIKLKKFEFNNRQGPKSNE